jgi:hypothetical protein
MFEEMVQDYSFTLDVANLSIPPAKLICMMGATKRPLEVGCAGGSLCRAHEALRVTAATQTGIISHIWTIEERLPEGNSPQ